MTDPLQSAIAVTKANASGVAMSAASAAATTAVAAIPAGVSDKLKKLPLTKDPDLLKQIAKAEAQKIVGEYQNKLEQEKEARVEGVKDKVATLASLAAGAVSLYLKLPILDPKLLAMLAFLKAKQELRELKQTASKKNVKKAKETFTFPMKPPTSLSGLPKIPEVPKLPTLPTLPAIPKLPNIPPQL